MIIAYNFGNPEGENLIKSYYNKNSHVISCYFHSIAPGNIYMYILPAFYYVFLHRI